MRNKVNVLVKFMNIPQMDDSNSFLKRLQDDLWSRKHEIMDNPSDASDLAYYSLQSKVYNALSDGNDSYKDDMYVSDVNYSLFERFSDEYGMSFNIHVAKFGPHIDDCQDITSVNYYNMTNTFIANGCMVKQMYLHVNADAVPADEHMITLFNDDCVHTLLSAKSVIENNLPDVQANREGFVVSQPERCVDDIEVTM